MAGLGGVVSGADSCHRCWVQHKKLCQQPSCQGEVSWVNKNNSRPCHFASRSKLNSCFLSERRCKNNDNNAYLQLLLPSKQSLLTTPCARGVSLASSAPAGLFAFILNTTASLTTMIFTINRLSSSSPSFTPGGFHLAATNKQAASCKNLRGVTLPL